MSEASGRVERIWIKRARGGPMDAVPSARAVAGSGLEGNADRGGKRQVTLFSAECWADVRAELGVDVDPRLRRANLLVSGIDFSGRRGRTLRIGDCRILVRGETVPCRSMDETQPGLQEALRPDWRGGVYGEVLDDGVISLGDAVAWLPD